MNEEETQRGSTKRQIARLIGNAATPIYVLGEDHRIVFANEALAMLLGMESETLLGLDCSKHIPLDNTQVSRVGALLAIPANSDRTVAQMHPFPAEEGESSRVCISIPLDDTSQPMVLCAIKEDRGERESLLGSHHRTRLQKMLLSSGPEADMEPDLWFLRGGTPAILRTRKQSQAAIQDNLGVHIYGPAPSSTLSAAKWIVRKRQSSISAGGSDSPIVVECRWIDRELLRGTLEMIDEQFRLRRRDAGPLSIIFHRIDAMQESLLDQLYGWSPPAPVNKLATSATQDLIALHANSESWGKFAANLESHIVQVPALAQRTADMEPLLVAWLQIMGQQKVDSPNYRWTREFLDAILAYPWPGDIEEFDRVMQEAIHRSQDYLLTERELPGSLRTYPSHVQRAEPLAPIDLEDVLQRIERQLIQQSMAHFPRNRTAVAGHLGISRAKLLRRLQQLGLAQPDTFQAADSEEPIFEEWDDTGSGQGS
jgi:DNA-binding protein Fis